MDKKIGILTAAITALTFGCGAIVGLYITERNKHNAAQYQQEKTMRDNFVKNAINKRVKKWIRESDTHLRNYRWNPLECQYDGYSVTECQEIRADLELQLRQDIQEGSELSSELSAVIEKFIEYNDVANTGYVFRNHSEVDRQIERIEGYLR